MNSSSILSFGPVPFLHQHIFSPILEVHEFFYSANEFLRDDEEIYKFSEIRTMRTILWITIFIKFLYMLLGAFDLWTAYRRIKWEKGVQKAKKELERQNLELERLMLQTKLVSSEVEIEKALVAVLKTRRLAMVEGTRLELEDAIAQRDLRIAVTGS